MAPRPDKAAAVAELTEAFRSSSAAVLTEYRGLTVAQLNRLRTALGDGTRYAIVKNTLTKLAARDAGLDALEPLLEGPTAVAFVEGDPVDAAKSLRDFARENPLLVLKGGVLEGEAVSVDEIRRLADLESREVLLAKLAGALNAKTSQAAALFQAPLSQAARLAQALVDAGGASGAPGATSDGGSGADTAPADTAPADTAPADAAPADPAPAGSAADA